MTTDGLVLLLPFSDRWEIAARPAGLPVWTAERSSVDGHSIRYIVARSAAELAAKLETAETVEP
jgi:hypothetical protein